MLRCVQYVLLVVDVGRHQAQLHQSLFSFLFKGFFVLVIKPIAHEWNIKYHLM
jgi:hypothetical protein